MKIKSAGRGIGIILPETIKHNDMKINEGALEQAMGCYAALAAFRRDRERNKRFNYGEQWGDLLEIDGHSLSEGDYMGQHGAVPLKNNMIRRLVRNVIGVYSQQSNQPRCVARDAAEQPLAATMTRLLKYNSELNRLEALYARTLEEFMISGMAVHRKWYGERGGRTDCWTDYVSPSKFFADCGMRDFRSWDCECVGEIHDAGFGEVCAQFAGSASDMADLRKIYGGGQGRCRVIELWRKEYRPCYAVHDPSAGTVRSIAPEGIAGIEAENRRRRRSGRQELRAKWQTAAVWRYYFLSPSGHVLAEGDTPYAHGSHPYVMKAYPMIDGEIHAFVSDVIDQQKFTNRLITTYDWIIRSSAKGLLLIPEDCIPRGSSPADFADVWSRFNGVLLYKPSMRGDVPRQVASNSTNIGITDLLNLQLKFFEDISGVNGALEGKLANASMSAALYGQQTQNATTALRDLLGTFDEFTRDAAYKDVSLMQQYYSEDMVRRIAGSGATALAGLGNAVFDLSIAPSDNTPATRQASNELLMEIWKSGQISLEQMLEAGDFPFADALRSTSKES